MLTEHSAVKRVKRYAEQCTDTQTEQKYFVQSDTTCKLAYWSGYTMLCYSNYYYAVILHTDTTTQELCVCTF